MIGTTVSHYRVLEKLGQGGMGVVYSAVDATLGRKVALKFCKTGGDPQRRHRLLEEAQAASALVHPNIAQIYEFGTTEDGEPFIVMELVPGASLSDKLQAGRLETGEALRVVSCVASALAAAHSVGVIHRDIKPSNIRITDSGEVKVLDFGLARLSRPQTPSTETVDATKTIEGRIKGTPAYMAPEQARGSPVDQRADLFSLGAVLYECLTGRSPFAGPTHTDSLAKVIETDPPAPSKVDSRLDPGLDKITLKLLAKHPGDRYASAEEFLAALKGLQSPWAVFRKRPFRLAAAALACMVLAASIYGLWRLMNAPHQPPIEAVRWYREGFGAMADGTFLKATKMLDRAVAIDPNYTMAHALLAESWNELENEDRAQQELIRAMPPGQNRRLPPRDSIHLRAIHATLTRSFDAAARLYRELQSRSQGLERTGALLDLGRVYERGGKWQEALDAYEEATRADPDSAAAFRQLAWYYARRARDKAGAPLDRAESLYRTTSNQEGLTECLYIRARVAPDAKSSMELLRRALAQAELSESAQQIIKIQLLLTERLSRGGETAEAAQVAQRAIRLAEVNGLQDLVARGLINIGNLLFLRGDGTARSYAQQALEIGRRRGSKPVEARALLMLGNIDIDTGRAVQGVPEVEQALTYFRNNGFSEETAQALTMLGRYRWQQGDYANAASAYSDAIATIGERRTPELGYAQEGLALVTVDQDRFPSAVGLFRQVRSTYEAAGYAPGKLLATSSLGMLYGLLGRDRDAQAEIAAAEPMAAALNTSWSRTIVGWAAAGVALGAGRYDTAARIAEQVLMKEQSDDPAQTCRVRLSLGLALARSGKMDGALAECKRARAEAATLAQPELSCETAIAYAETTSLARRGAEAESAIKGALGFIRAAGKSEAAWRSWALLARVRTGEARSEAIRNAQAEFAKLRSSWPDSDVQSYVRRPDIASLLKVVQPR